MVLPRIRIISTNQKEQRIKRLESESSKFNSMVSNKKDTTKSKIQNHTIKKLIMEKFKMEAITLIQSYSQKNSSRKSKAKD